MYSPCDSSLALASIVKIVTFVGVLMISDDFFKSYSNAHTIFDFRNFECSLCIVSEDRLGQSNFIIFIIGCILHNICIIIFDFD